MQGGQSGDEAARAFLTRVALEVLMDCESSGIAVTRELMRHCVIAAMKSWLDSDQAQTIFGPIIDRAYETYCSASEAKPN